MHIRSYRSIVNTLVPVVSLGILLMPVFATAQGQNKNDEADEEQALSVDEIVKKANYVAYYQGKDGRARVQMTIADKQGRTRKRELTILRRDQAPEDAADEAFTGDQKLYAYFHRPPDVNGTVFMVWKHLKGDDDRWLYLPALDLVRRIAASDKRTSFVGSHFFYEDVSGRTIRADTHELVETTDSFYVLKNTPRKPDLVEFDYYKMWIHKKTFIPVKSSYFKKDREYRTYEVLEVAPVDGYQTVTKSKMTDRDMGGHTVLEYTNVKYNIGLPEQVFTERYLRRPPRKYLR